MVEHVAHLALRLVNQPLVDHAARDPRLHRVEMAHEAPIIAIEFPDAFEAVRKANAGRVILFEIGKAARHRMAARVDDARIRKGHPDEREIGPIARQLVDEKRLPGLSEWPRALQIFLADLAKL